MTQDRENLTSLRFGDGESAGEVPARAIRVIIADAQAMFREGLRSILEQQPDIRVVAQVGRAADIESTLMESPCDILLIDLQMDRWTMGDIEGLAQRVLVAVVTAQESTEDGLTALRLGARAVVWKRYGAETLITALRTLASGNVSISAELQTEFLNRSRAANPVDLTERESEIVRQVASGFKNAEVASRLSIAESTVKTHLNNIFQKLGLRHRTQLVRYALRMGVAHIADA